jgi:hypothetical protein
MGRLIDVGRNASALFVQTGDAQIRVGSKLANKRRRNKEVKEERFRQENDDAGPELVEELVELRKWLLEEKQDRKLKKHDRAVGGKWMANHPAREALLQCCPDLYDVQDQLTLVSVKPPIFWFSAFKDAAGDKIIPPELWDELRANASKMREQSREWENRHVIVKERPIIRCVNPATAAVVQINAWQTACKLPRNVLLHSSHAISIVLT